jgi:hypothetical protein
MKFTDRIGAVLAVIVAACVAVVIVAATLRTVRWLLGS